MSDILNRFLNYIENYINNRKANTMNEKLKNQIVRHEGLMLKVYQCSAKKWTIGVGRNVQDRGITKEEAMFLLDNDLKFFEDDVKKKIPWYEQLDEVRKCVLINMAFNMGTEGLLKFTNTLKLIEEKKYKEASENMLKSKWAEQVGVRAKELSKQMETGEWQK